MQEQGKRKKSLFDWATSELSQDAVLLWFLDNKKVNKEVLGNLLCRNIKGEKVDNSLPYGIKEILEPKKQEHHGQAPAPPNRARRPHPRHLARGEHPPLAVRPQGSSLTVMSFIRLIMRKRHSSLCKTS